MKPVAYLVYVTKEGNPEQELACVCTTNAKAHEMGKHFKHENPYVVDYYLDTVWLVEG